MLECGGIELLFRCANVRFRPDIVTAVLWNICAESEVQGTMEAVSDIAGEKDSTESTVHSGNSMSSVACTQLALRSIGECDDFAGKSLLAAEIQGGRRHTNVIKELLDLADIMKDDTWKEMVAEILEKASWSGNSPSLML